MTDPIERFLACWKVSQPQQAMWMGGFRWQHEPLSRSAAARPSRLCARAGSAVPRTAGAGPAAGGAAAAAATLAGRGRPAAEQAEAPPRLRVAPRRAAFAVRQRCIGRQPTAESCSGRAGARSCSTARCPWLERRAGVRARGRCKWVRRYTGALALDGGRKARAGVCWRSVRCSTHAAANVHPGALRELLCYPCTYHMLDAHTNAFAERWRRCDGVGACAQIALPSALRYVSPYARRAPEERGRDAGALVSEVMHMRGWKGTAAAEPVGASTLSAALARLGRPCRPHMSAGRSAKALRNL